MAETGTRKQLEADMSDLKRMVLRLGMMSGDALSRAVRALEKGDASPARAVIDGDDELDDLTERIGEGCMAFTARHQPLGQDLRTVVSIIHIATDLERVGDYGVNISRTVLGLEDRPLLKPLIDIPRMAELLLEMLNRALVAFDVGDAETARKLFIMDEQIDALEKQVLRELITMVLERTERLEQAFMLLNVARTLERAGDHLTNIAERVVYMYTGKMARASDYKTPRGRQ
ncbi:MAG: phosphate signaling complex protein PhoU [Synergistaceae bacterium]|nr:phosphate signaling complex protein PhoU [Synergistaceae bacterium]